MIKTKKNGELIIISGTTCAGKFTVISKLLSDMSEAGIWGQRGPITPM